MEKLSDKNLTGKGSDRRERLAVFIARFVVKRRFLVLLFMVSATVFWLYHAVQVPYVVQCALERAGVDTIHDVLSGEDTFDTRKMTETDEARLDEALTMIERAGVTVDKRVVSFFDPIDESQEQLWGAVRDRRIFINYELCAPGKLNALVGTLIHENDHIQSGLHDDEEEFRHIADDLIGRLIIENYR